MYIEEKYKDIGLLNSGIDEILNLCKGKWHIDESRQLRFGVHMHTKAVVLRNAPFNGELTAYRNTKLFDEFEDLLQPLFKKINKTYNYEYFDANKIIIVDLRSGKSIPEHSDSGDVFPRVHRIHWTLKTSSDVHFYIDHKRLPFRNGVILEISNIAPHMHKVINNGRESRYHLIIDCFNNEQEQKTIIKD